VESLEAVIREFLPSWRSFPTNCQVLGKQVDSQDSSFAGIQEKSRCCRKRDLCQGSSASPLLNDPHYRAEMGPCGPRKRNYSYL
jgi:hypothetical protein